MAPTTMTRFYLNNSKTRIHHLTGEAGLEFLSAVQQSFALVASETRALLGNVDRLEAELETVALFDTTRETDGIPRLRDADRFSLRRFAANALIKGLQRHATLLTAGHARRFLQKRTKRLLSALEGGVDVDNFDFAIALLKVALLCECEPVVARVWRWLARHTGVALDRRLASVTWMNHELYRDQAVRGLQSYLQRRIDEAVAAACSFDELDLPGAPVRRLRRNAINFRHTDLRQLDREDDLSVFHGTVLRLPMAAQREHQAAERILKSHNIVRQLLKAIEVFLKRSALIGDHTWENVTNVATLLTTKPPTYLDIARRFLFGIESDEDSVDIGAKIDRCASAIRGAHYATPDRQVPTISVMKGETIASVTVGAPQPPDQVRLILANLSVSKSAFRAAALGNPSMTARRLRSLDTVLREAQRAARDAAKAGRPSLLLLPELSVPRRWVRTLAEHAVDERLPIVAGIEYKHTTKGLINEAIGIFPHDWRWHGKRAAFVGWTKQFPAYGEATQLASLGRQFRSFPNQNRRTVVTSMHGRVGVLICSEILQTGALAALTGSIELLLVPAWNDDTWSFEHAAHAIGLLIHAFVGIANNSEASDCRISAPIKDPRHERDWSRLIHRGESRIVWGDLPMNQLQEIHFKPRARLIWKVGKGARSYRPVPPGWGSKRNAGSTPLP